MPTPLEQAQTSLARGASGEARRLLEQNIEAAGCAVRLRELLIGEGLNEAGQAVAARLAAGQGPEAHVSRSFLALRGGDLQAALRECNQALQADPRTAAAWNHAGRALNNSGQVEQAVGAFRKAVELQPDYPEAWHNLGHVLRIKGDLAAACDAYSHALELAPGYRSARLNLGKTLYHRDLVKDAMQCFDDLLERDPGDVEALVDGGLTLHLLGRLEESRSSYEHALRLDPDCQPAWCYLGILLNEFQDDEGAVKALEKALELDPGDVEAWVELAGTHELCNRLDKAAEAVHRGLAVDPGYAPLQVEAAKVERRRGEVESAIRRLRAVDPQRLPPRLRKPYFFELGQSLDRSGDAEAAYQAFASGNRLAAGDVRRSGIDPESFPRSVSWVRDWIASGAPGARPQAGDPQDDQGRDLCFLIGFPRSGSTLLDMMLDVHPQVASIEEKGTLEAVIRTLHALPGGYPASMGAIDAGLLAELRERYRSEAAAYVEAAAGRIILDKMPMRFMHAGLINRLFPRARLLFSMRHPCDVVLSNFMQQYPSATDFQILFDSLEGAAAVFDLTLRLWQALEPLLDLPIEYLRYEDLVADPVLALERVCDFIGIERDREMLDTGARLRTRDRVTTPSYQQVAEPIYRRAAGRWLRYRRHLEPCLSLLQPHIERYGFFTEA